jgi:hypothetical protein
MLILRFFCENSPRIIAASGASSYDVIKINQKCFLYAETYMLRFVQIRNNHYENRLIFFTFGEYEYCISKENIFGLF